MPLTNKQYDTIMREYDRRQYQDYRLQCTRIDQIYEQIPRIREIDSEISACSLRQAERMIDQEPGAMKSLKDELALLKAEKEGLLLSAGYPADYLKMHYTCPECKDTGYIGRKKCHCFLQQEIRLLYSSSHLDQILAEENFSHLSYDVYDENENAKYFVKAEFFSLGHQLHIYDRNDRELGVIRQRLFTLLPAFEIEIGGQVKGEIRKQFSFFKPRYEIDYNGWRVEGDFLGWDYDVYNGCSSIIHISKELFHWGDTYTINFADPKDELEGLMLVIAIDAANCTQNNG